MWRCRTIREKMGPSGWMQPLGVHSLLSTLNFSFLIHS